MLFSLFVLYVIGCEFYSPCFIFRMPYKWRHWSKARTAYALMKMERSYGKNIFSRLPNDIQHKIGQKIHFSRRFGPRLKAWADRARSVVRSRNFQASVIAKGIKQPGGRYRPVEYTY